MRVYLAAPLFSAAERDFNLTLATRLETADHHVFLPQRDSPQDDQSPGYTTRVFAADRDGIDGADIVVAVCDGMPVDDGTAWEIGYAVGRGTRAIGLRTDSRIVGPEERVNLMIQESVCALVASIDELLDKLRELASTDPVARD